MPPKRLSKVGANRGAIRGVCTEPVFRERSHLDNRRGVTGHFRFEMGPAGLKKGRSGGIPEHSGTVSGGNSEG